MLDYKIPQLCFGMTDFLVELAREGSHGDPSLASPRKMICHPERSEGSPGPMPLLLLIAEE